MFQKTEPSDLPSYCFSQAAHEESTSMLDYTSMACPNLSSRLCGRHFNDSLYSEKDINMGCCAVLMSLYESHLRLNCVTKLLSALLWLLIPNTTAVHAIIQILV